MTARHCLGPALLCAAAAATPAGIDTNALAAQAASAADVALEHVRGHKQDFGLSGSDINEIVVSSTVVSDHNGVTHVYLQQQYRGIDVWNGILNIGVKDAAVISAASRFTANIAASAGGQSARKIAVDAAGAAAAHVKLKPTKPFEVLDRKGGPSEAVTISDGGIAARPIAARLVWVPVDSTSVRLAWLVEIDEVGEQHWWQALVDAETGASLGTLDLVIHDSAPAIAAAIAHPVDAAAVLPSFPVTDGAQYRVFPLPFESPSDGDRALVSNVANPAASPFGWHDTDGLPGAEFTVTRGNNVHAYADRNADNIPDPLSDPDGGPGLLFDFPLNLSARPLDSQAAIVTNLFYWNNIVHDVTHGYGFNEAAGNFQVNNYGNGGAGADDVRAEAQDGSGRNNANFGTPVDGFRPRMQMFEWRSSLPNPIAVSAPSAIAGTYYARMAAFGPALGEFAPFSGQIVLVNDGVDTLTDGCQPFVVPAGAIPLADRGNCNFTVKVKNAQTAGAGIMVVANNVAGPAITMGGTDPTITIPSVMITLDDGNLFKANLPVTATIADGAGLPDRDSDLDAGVIAHEYGHGVSNRLTGGPATVSCLGNAEQMGEGWSDWFGLTFTTHASDTATTRRGVGAYVSFEPADGDGIRPTPYTTDMTINPSTYASVADVENISRPHGIGYVWNTMLWEVYWNLVDRYGYNPDIYGPWSSGGNNLALQLVMDGMKMQPCRPGFVDGRNGILAADSALTGGRHQCEIWRGFAKRGLGASASQGDPNNRSGGTQAFDLPAACTAATFGAFAPPIEAAPAINAVNAGSTIPVKFTLTGAGSSLAIDSQPLDCTTLEPTGEAPSPLGVPGSTTLLQDGDAFHVNWQTDAAWAGSCRRLTLRIPAAADAVAYFRFF